MFSSNLTKLIQVNQWFHSMTHCTSLLRASVYLTDKQLFLFIFFFSSYKNTDSTSVRPDTFATPKHLAWLELICVHVSLVLFGQLPAASNHLHNVSGIWTTSSLKAIPYRAKGIYPQCKHYTSLFATHRLFAHNNTNQGFKCLFSKMYWTQSESESLALHSSSKTFAQRKLHLIPPTCSCCILCV